MRAGFPASAALLGLLIGRGAAGGPADEQYLAQLQREAPQLRELFAEYPHLRETLVEPRWRDLTLHAPFLPGGRWRVDDIRRPQPPLVDSAATGLGLSQRPPDAIVLFDGSGLAEWQGEGLAHWTVEAGALVASGAEYGLLETRRTFCDVQLHVEWATPDPPHGRWQYRGNSGVYLLGRYEVQILDSWKNPTFPDGQAGAVFAQTPPLVNASRPPGVWQSFDIVFEAPRFAGSALQRPAYVTVFQNGVLVQNHTRILGEVTAGQLAKYSPHPPTGALMLQDHGDSGSRVRFRNIWVRALAAR
jgi:3-keto-disaccharide hydrolase